MRNNRLGSKFHTENEFDTAKKLFKSLSVKEYNEVCVNLAHLILNFVENTECDMYEIVGDIAIPMNKISLERACGLMGGWLSHFISTDIHSDRARLLRDMVAMSGFDFKNMFNRIGMTFKTESEFENLDSEINAVIEKMIDLTKQK